MSSALVRGLQAIRDAVKRSNDAVAEGRRLTRRR
jgi:hypothetical protein